MSTSPATAASSNGSPPSGADRHFRTDHLLTDLKGRAVRGGAITLASQGVKFFLQLGSTMVLARQLTPNDFGLVAMVTAFTSLVTMFKDAGLSAATVQREHITQAQVSTLFWLNVALSTTVMLVMASMAPFIAWFYNEPKLLWIALTLAALSIFNGLSGQHLALLRRQMRFRDLAVIEIVSMAAGIGTAIVMALMGMGYWSLVGLTAGGAIANCVLVWTYSGWRPGPPSRGSGVLPMIKFGAGLTLGSLFSQLGDQFPYMIIGHSLGSGPVALYERAYRLLIMPLTRMMPAISGVAIPALSRVQSDAERQRRVVRTLISLVVACVAPMSVLGIVLAPEIILILLGPKWSDSATLFACLAPLAAVQPISAVVIWTLLTSGRTDVLMKYHALNAGLIASAIVIGLQFGLVGAALGVSLMGVFISAPILFRLASKHTAVTIGDLLGGSWPVLATGAGLTAAGLLVRQSSLVSENNHWVFALIFGAVAGVWWGTVMYCKDILGVIRSARSMKAQAK